MIQEEMEKNISRPETKYLSLENTIPTKTILQKQRNKDTKQAKICEFINTRLALQKTFMWNSTSRIERKIILSEVSQAQKTKNCMFSLICSL
jgi:hypothetical protein